MRWAYTISFVFHFKFDFQSRALCVLATMAQTTPALNQTHSLLFSFVSKPSIFPLHLGKPLLSVPYSLSSSFSSTTASSSRCCRLSKISTALVEYAAPAPDFDFEQEIVRLRNLRSELSGCKNLKDKLAVVDGDSRVQTYFKFRQNEFAKAVDWLNLNYNEVFLLKCLVAAGQEHVLGFDTVSVDSEFESVRSSLKRALYAMVEMIEKLDVNGSVGAGAGASFGKKIGITFEDEEVSDLMRLLKCLEEIEMFYDCIGGIIGYQITLLELLMSSTSERRTKSWSGSRYDLMESQIMEIHSPSGIDLSVNTEYASQAALWGIEGLPNLAEIYPLGGAADRLGLVDPDTGECLPAAMLPYCGRTLLEGLIRDLQAREFLYHKMYGKQCITPVAIMTSSAKNNHERVTSLCERLGWFGRGRSSFKLFEQPLVPAISAEDGSWLVTKQFVPVCKPGGHGVLWKLAHDKGIFKWFHTLGRKGATIRQVSNVVAGTDLTLLALAGIGLHNKKKLGFASCKRNNGATEGINVLVERKIFDGRWAYGLSCIEYTEFDKFGINSGPPSPNSLQAEFPANTNILYVDLASVELVASTNNEKSLPGMVLNLKKPISYLDHFGQQHSVCGGRLECTMQKIADSFYNTSTARCYDAIEDKLDAYIVYNERKRVTSSAKRKRKQADKSLHQTPDGSFLDILRNAHDLLVQCDIELPKIEANDKYVDSEPPFLILLHPALGPLWEVTKQKFSGGLISKGSELQVEVAEFLWKNVQLNGSLIILAENIMGSLGDNGNGELILCYGHRCSRCKLQNVKILNEGIDWYSGANTYWKHDVQRSEAFKIILHGNAEFEATDVIIQGNHVFEVPDGHKMKITSGSQGLAVQLDPIELNKMDRGSWQWNYKINGAHVDLEYSEL